MLKYFDTDTIIGRNLKQLLNAIPLSLREFSSIANNLSQSTLSRIINGSTTFKYEKIEIIGEVFGIVTTEIQTKSFAVPERPQLIRSIKRYAKRNNPDIDLKQILSKDHTAHFIDLYVNSGMLDNFQDVGEIKKKLKQEFDIVISSSNISLVLTRRANVEDRSGKRTNTKEYRRKKS